MIDYINQSGRPTSCALIRDGLFTSWKFGFAFDPRLYILQLPVIELFLLRSSSSWRTDTIFFAKLNKPSLKFRLK